jgi:hypothetical protein
MLDSVAVGVENVTKNTYFCNCKNSLNKKRSIRYMLLSELQTGQSAVVVKVLGHGGFRRRILEMGFVRGQRVVAILNAPLRDPI